MDLKGAQQYPTQEELTNIVRTFQANFEYEGFLAFTAKSQINFKGSILLNYRGLRLLKLKKSQLHIGDFDQSEFQNICKKILAQPKQQEELVQVLGSTYLESSFCVVTRGHFVSAGQLASVTVGETTVFIY